MSTILGSEQGQAAQQPQESGNPGAQSGQTPPATPPAQQSGTSSWRDTLPDDLKNDVSLAQFTDIGALAKSYKHAQSLIGKKGVIPPGEKAAPEEWEGFYKALGRPDMDKYDIKAKETYNQKVVDKFKGIFHKAGLLPKQAQEVLDAYAEYDEEMIKSVEEADKQATAEALNSLKKEWGEGFGKNISLIKSFLKDAGPEFEQYFTENDVGNDPMVLKLLAKQARYLGEDKIRGAAAGNMGMTPDEIASTHEELQRKMWSMSKDDPQYVTITRKVEELARKRYGA